VTAPRRPRSIASAVGALRASTAPQTLLAAVEMAWPDVAGEAIAAEATPVGERAGVVTVSCRSAVWAQELDLLGPDLLARLNAVLDAPVEALRFTADAARHDQH
jgi:predicted nucleic acid-binding Zn ribbon protein